MVNIKLQNRFLNYIKFDTQSDETSSSIPSTIKQKALATYLVDELHQIGLKNAYMDEFGYVYAFVESNCNCEETIGLIAHMDTSDEASGKNIVPQIVKNYDGKTIVLNENLNMVLDPIEFPYLLQQIGHTLITTDGTTLLGADDKAGIAIIVTAVEELLHSNVQYPNLIITFTPDEEIGRGTDAFNYQYYREHNCRFAYTLDGGEPKYISYENFNAASCVVQINGKSIHPGSAKNKMINSQLIAMEFNGLLPSNLLPSLTEGYEGFNHLVGMSGTVSSSTLTYIIRNHNKTLFEQQKAFFKKAMDFMNNKYGENLISISIKDSYYNMKEIVDNYPIVIDKAVLALSMNGITPSFDPIRGGTDGARLTFEGVITPNLGTGGQAFHGPYEYLDLDEASLMVNVVKKLVFLYTQK